MYYRIWLTLLLLVFALGQCQCEFWTKSNELNVFAAAPQQLAAEVTVDNVDTVVTGVHTTRKNHSNNVTLAADSEFHSESESESESKDLDLDLDSLAPLSQRKLSRGKRFVAFPLGSSASAALCLTTGVIGNPHLLYLSFGLNWGVAYNLPNITWVLNNAHGWNTKKPNAALAKIKRRHRRNVYGNLETMIDSAANATPAHQSVAFMSHKTEASLQPRHVNASNDLWPPPTLMTMMERAKTSTSTSTSTMASHPSISLNKSKSVRSLSRPKRYLSFPEGSSFTVSVCFTVGIIGNPYFAHNSFGLNWGVAYDLPNNTWILQSLHGFPRRPITTGILRRRSRNAIYQDIEAVVDNMGYNGRDCILRTLCESRQYFQSTKLNMVGEMLRAIFSLPKQRIFKRELNENADILHYDNAYRHAHDVDCARQYDCNFSLLELAFGKYSRPPKNYYAQ